VEVLGRGYTWLDAGTPEALLKATHFVSTIQERQGLKISCIEEIAYRLGYIDSKQLAKLANYLLKTEYGQYLLQLANEEI
jgi:glucose-1-phosphate thymidylyltransferase